MKAFLEKKDDIKVNTIKKLLSKKKPVSMWIDEFKCERVPGLETYLKDSAIGDACRCVNSTYLVYDDKENMLVGYFSLKSSAIIHNVDQETLDSMFQEDPAARDFFEQEEENSRKLNIYSSTPCIEIPQFALNDNYLNWLQKNGYNNKGVGNYIFKNMIKRILFVLSDNIGVALLTLFAYRDEKGKVIRAYQQMGFKTLEDDDAGLVPVAEDWKPLKEVSNRGADFMFYEMQDIVSEMDLEI